MVAKQRGGFFSAIGNFVKRLAAPVISKVIPMVSGLFGGTKKAATHVAHNAINNVAQGSQQALKTGKWKQEMTGAFNKSKQEAHSTMQSQYSGGRDSMRDQMSKQIADLQAQLNKRMESQYNTQYQRH